MGAGVFGEVALAADEPALDGDEAGFVDAEALWCVAWVIDCAGTADRDEPVGDELVPQPALIAASAVTTEIAKMRIPFSIAEEPLIPRARPIVPLHALKRAHILSTCGARSYLVKAGRKVSRHEGGSAPSRPAGDPQMPTDRLRSFSRENLSRPGVPWTMEHDANQLSTGEVRRRAVTGAVVDALRAIGNRFVGLVGTLVTARLLTPYDFGLVAIGATVLAFGNLLDDGGIGTALIRRPEEPTKAELRALVAFQFGLELILATGTSLVMLQFGRIGQITAVIIISLPLSAFRAPATILYERRLDYKPMAIIDVVETCVYYVWAITTILLGWGVWGLATAMPVRSVVGLGMLLISLPEGRVMPRPSWTKVRGLLGFGVRYQAVNLLHMLRDQGVNIAVASFGGVAVLGLWGIAWRIIQLPVSLFAALWRVSFPGMSRLVAAKEDVGGTIERVIALVAIGTGVLVVPLAASASAWVNVLIGPQWTSASSAIPPACFAMMFGVPISVALAGYLWAIGAASVPLRATAIGIPATMLVLLPLLPLLDVTAVGIAYIASSAVESAFFVYAARRTTSFRIGRRLGIPVALAVVAASCGWLVERLLGPDLVGGVLSSAAAIAIFLGGLAAVHRPDLTDAWRLLLRGLHGVVARSSEGLRQPQPVAG